MSKTPHTLPPPALAPQRGERGLLSQGFDQLGERTLTGWQAFLEATANVDPAGSTRSRGRDARTILLGLGTWPTSYGIPEMLADGRAGNRRSVPFEVQQRQLRDVHRRADMSEVRHALVRGAEQARSWFTSATGPQEAHVIVPSVLGPLPLATVVHAAVYQLAITARDLAPAGAKPSEELDRLGLAALVDSAGAVAARNKTRASITAITTHDRWGTGTVGTDWTTRNLGADEDAGPSVEAPVGLLLDLTAGRLDFIAVARQLRVHHPRDLMAISTILDDLPELPGGPVLRRAGKIVRRLSR